MIYIQSNSDRTIPHHFDAATAMYGAIEQEIKYRLTSFEEVKSGKFDNLIKTNLFVGSVEFMREVFNRVDRYPNRLPNSNRTFETITLGEARKRGKNGEKLFIKPFTTKLFTGFVIDESDYMSIRDISDDTLVMAYQPIDQILSEWRIYVYNGVLVDSRHYSGDFWINPNYVLIADIIKNNNDFPVAYTVDVGICYKNTLETFIVEYNDMWAISNYGIPNDLYLKLLKARYFEIIK